MEKQKTAQQILVARVRLAIGYLLCVTILLMPVGLQMFRLTPMMTTLRRY